MTIPRIFTQRHLVFVICVQELSEQTSEQVVGGYYDVSQDGGRSFHEPRGHAKGHEQREQHRKVCHPHD